MNMTEQRARQSRMRDRRAIIVSAVLLGVIAIVFTVMAQYPRGGVPISVRGPATVTVTAMLVGASLFYERADEWQRRRAALAFGLGSLVGVAFLMIESLRSALDGGHSTRPGLALAVIGLSWLGSDFLLRMWPTMRSEDDA